MPWLDEDGADDGEAAEAEEAATESA
jgi:hypothetical protein